MKFQKILLGCSILAFLILYFGFSKISPELKRSEKSDPQNIENAELQTQVSRAKDSLQATDNQYLTLLDQELNSAVTDSSKASILKQISAYWYKLNKPIIAAGYALNIAKISPSGESWSIAGANYVLAARQTNLSPELKMDLGTKARECFTQAALLDPKEINHRVNKALVATEFLSDNNPMTGILELRTLNEENPENVTVLFHLARLASQTNQWEKAKERLEAGLKIDPQHQNSICLIVTVYHQLGDEISAMKWAKLCNSMHIDNK